MFQYEHEKRPPSAGSSSSRAPMSAEWNRSYPTSSRSYPSTSRRYPSTSRSYPSTSRVQPSVEKARRPLPPRPIVDQMPTKTTVPLKVWIVASASCFAVCAALVLATVVITRWGAEEQYTREVYQQAEPIYSPLPQPITESYASSSELDKEIAILEKLSLFKNIVSNRNKDLLTKPQLHPLHETIHHAEKKIEKKDRAKLPDDSPPQTVLPEFNPNLPTEQDIKNNYFNNLNTEYEDYYNDENLYDDYMQSNTMTSYLIEKIQELHDWITTDPDLAKNATKVDTKNDFSQLLKALNDSLVEGNVTIVMNKLREIYFGDNFTMNNSGRKVILTNTSDLLSFGILTLDIMLLHNIQLMAWENQEAARTKMLKDPNVFAFNALFLDPGKVEAKQAEVQQSTYAKRQIRLDPDASNLGTSFFENALEFGMGAARAAIHLGRAYKNTRNILSQLSSREPANIQSQISRHVDENTHALNHLQTSFDVDSSVVNNNGSLYTELDCVWLLYCRNLVVTAKLNAPFGTMARINGMALRMLAGDLSADRALDTMLYEAMTGWTELQCNDMFPRCSKVNAASVVMDTIIQKQNKKQSNRGR